MHILRQNNIFFFNFLLCCIIYFQFMQDLKIQKFTHLHIPQYLQFAFDAYQAGNSFVEHTPQNKERFQKVTKNVVALMVEAADIVNAKRGTNTNFNTFIRKDGKMICASFACEFKYFFQVLVPQKIDDGFYDQIPKQFTNSIKQYTAVVGVRGTVRKEYQGSGIFKINAMQRLKDQAKDGYKVAYSATLNQKVLGFYKKNGTGDILFSFKESLLGHIYEMQFIKVDFECVLNTLKEE